MKYLIALILLVFGFFGISSAQDADETTWIVNSSESIRDIIDSDYIFNKTTISPDGRFIAWIEGGSICLHEIQREASCFELEWNPSFMRSQYNFHNVFLQWSPDSQYIALAQDPFFLGFDSDIWLFDTLSHEFTNLTEDGFDGVLDLEGVVYSDVPADYLPMWKSNNELIFFRTFRVSSNTLMSPYQYPYEGLFLYSISIEQQEIQLEMDLSDVIAPGDMAGAFNSTGSMLALIAPNIITEVDPNLQFGAFLVNVDANDVHMLANSEDLADYLFTWLTPTLLYPASNRSVVWHHGDEGIVMAFNWLTGEGIFVPQQFWFDITDNSIDAIVDYSSIPLTSSAIDEYVNDVVILPPSGEDLYIVARTSDSNTQSLYSTSTDFTQTPQFIQDLTFVRGFVEGVVVMSSNGSVMASDLTLIEFDEVDN